MVEQVAISEDEAALYDRQIRLWGLDAQRRLLMSKCFAATTALFLMYQKSLVTLFRTLVE